MSAVDVAWSGPAFRVNLLACSLLTPRPLPAVESFRSWRTPTPCCTTGSSTACAATWRCSPSGTRAHSSPTRWTSPPRTRSWGWPGTRWRARAESCGKSRTYPYRWTTTTPRRRSTVAERGEEGREEVRARPVVVRVNLVNTERARDFVLGQEAGETRAGVRVAIAESGSDAPFSPRTASFPRLPS